MTAMTEPTPSERQRDIDAAIEALAAPRQSYTAQPRPKGFFSTSLGAVVIVAAFFGAFAIMLWSAPIGVILLIVLVVWGVIGGLRAMAAAEEAEYGPPLTPATRRSPYGEINPQLTCPHCQVRGEIHVQEHKVKQGISGGKATGAILTGGASLWLTGLSRKGYVTSLHCDNCSMTWSV